MGPFVGGIVTILVIVIGVIQALAAVFKSAAEAQEKIRRQAMANQGKAGAKNAPSPSSFLPEMTQRGTARPAAAVSRPASVARPQQAAGQVSSQPARQKTQQAAGGRKKPPARQPGIAQARPERSPGSGVGSHVESYIGQHVKSHIGTQLAAAVKNDIGDQVRSHLGEDRNKPAAPTVATTHGSAAAGDLLLALRSPQGIRQAILVSEILTRPRALRRS